MTKTRTATLLAATFIALTACSSDDGDDEQPGMLPIETADTPTVVDLGATHTYDDGFAVSVDIAEVFVPSEVDNFDSDEPHVLLTATIQNGTEAPIEVSAVFQDCVVDGTTVSYDGFLGITSDWPGMVQPGREGSWQYACSVGDGAELEAQMQINDYPAVWFAGPVPQ